MSPDYPATVEQLNKFQSDVFRLAKTHQLTILTWTQQYNQQSYGKEQLETEIRSYVSGTSANVAAFHQHLLLFVALSEIQGSFEFVNAFRSDYEDRITHILVMRIAHDPHGVW